MNSILYWRMLDTKRLCGAEPIDEMWRLNISNMQWTNVTLADNRPLPRFLAGFSASNSKLHIFGGVGAAGTLLLHQRRRNMTGLRGAKIAITVKGECKKCQ